MSAEETGREQMTQTVTVVAVVIEGGPGTVQKVFETVMGGTAVRFLQIREFLFRLNGVFLLIGSTFREFLFRCNQLFLDLPSVQSPLINPISPRYGNLN